MDYPRVRHLVWIAIAAYLLIWTPNAWGKSPINTNWRGLAVKGYDVVAYFELGQPVKGTKSFSYRWQEAIWRFSSPEHLAAFKVAPEKYAPQYGGY